MAMEGLETVHLKPGEYGISYIFPPVEKTMKAFGRNPKPININDTNLTLAKDGIWQRPFKNNNILDDQGMIVVPQALTEKLDKQLWVLNFQYSPGRELHNKWADADVDGYNIWSRDEVLISIMADNMLVTYLGIYLGITFLITAGAVLALKQLTHASDLVKHYNLLKQLGVSKGDRKRSLKKHLSIYFGLPMILALLHSGVITGCIFRNFKGMGPAVTASVIGFSMLLVLSVFSVYLIVTYICSRNILEI